MTAAGGIWHGRVLEVNGDDLTVYLTRDSCPDFVAEVSVSQWELDGAQPGDILELDRARGSVKRLDFGHWTQEELDEIIARARERSAEFHRLAH